jgi:gliding motility-associated-like protein
MRAVLLLFILLGISLSPSWAQRGKIITPATTTVLDPNQDGFVSTTTAGFDPALYGPDQFEIRMFGIPYYGSGEALRDNQVGPQCGTTDIIVDEKGFGVYAVLDDNNNLIFRFRVGTNSPSVEAYTVLIDTDGKFGAEDPNATGLNPGFEIDITMVKNQQTGGVYVYDVDGVSDCSKMLKKYEFQTNVQLAIADLISCNNPDYFYDFYIPFQIITDLFGVTDVTELRFAAVTNISATCAFAGKISDVNGVDDNEYNGDVIAMFEDLVQNQCPIPLTELCGTCSGFKSGRTPRPTIDVPLKEGQTIIRGSSVAEAQVFLDLFNPDRTFKSSVTTLTGADDRWAATLGTPLAKSDSVTARAQLAGQCQSGVSELGIDYALVDENIPPIVGPPVPGQNPPLIYTEGDGPVIIQPGLVVGDPDDTVLEGALVAVVANYVQGEDILSFANQAGITGSFNPATGELTLTGTASVTQYQLALRNVAYTNTSDNPSTEIRVVRFQVRDLVEFSSPYEREIHIIPVNDPPVLTGSATAKLYFSPQIELVVDEAIEITDPDNTSLVGGTVSISANFVAGEDVLHFTNQNGITGTYNAATGVLTLTGTATLALYRDALRSIRYQSTLASPTLNTRTVSFRVNDGQDLSNIHTRQITFEGINRPPRFVDENGNPLESLEYTINEDEVLNTCFLVMDPDGDIVTFVSITHITENGTTEKGDGFCFTFTPLPNFFGEHQMTFRICDNRDPSLCTDIPVLINVLPVNDPPVLTGSATAVVYNVLLSDLVIDPAISITDVDNTHMVGGSVAIVNNFVAAEDVLKFTNQNGITGSYNTGSGVLTLTGSATIAHYEQALASVQYHNSNGDPNRLTRRIRFLVSDGEDNSNAHFRNINFEIPVNNPPEIYDEDNNGPLVTIEYTINEDEVLEACIIAIDPDGDAVLITNVTVVGTSGGTTQLGPDPLCFIFTPIPNFNGTHEMDFQVCDDRVPPACTTIRVIIHVLPVNDCPDVTGSPNPVQYPFAKADILVDPAVTITDPDNTHMEGGEVWISNNFIPAEDELLFENQNGITGTYNETTGALALNGTATLANYITALRSIRYKNNSVDPTMVPRTVRFRITDGECFGEEFSRIISFEAVNRPPVIFDGGGNQTDTLRFQVFNNELLSSCIDADDPDGDMVFIGNFDNLTGNGSFVVGDPLCFEYTPNAGFVGEEVIHVFICDDRVPSLCTKVVLMIDVLRSNTPPTIVTTLFEVPENSTSQLCLTITDAEDDPAFLKSLTFLDGTGNLSAPTGLCFWFTPPANFVGDITLEAVVCDVNFPNLCSTGQIIIRVLPVNKPPITLVNSLPGDLLEVATPINTPVVFCFEVVDPEGDNVHLESVDNLDGGGTLDLDWEGIEFCYEYTPPFNFIGDVRYEFNICDDGSPVACATLIALIDVYPTNQPPVAVNDTLYVEANMVGTGNVLDNDYDPDGDALRVVVTPVVGPQHGTIALMEDGRFEYQSKPLFTGTDRIRYRVCDDGIPSLCAEADIVVEVIFTQLRVYQAVSPNGDGSNDYWRIDDIEKFPNNTVRLFDRFNNLIYEKKGYTNEDKPWQGESNKGINKAEVPEGTYFYTIDLGTGRKLLSGYLVLKRQ